MTEGIIRQGEMRRERRGKIVVCNRKTDEGWFIEKNKRKGEQGYVLTAMGLGSRDTPFSINFWYNALALCPGAITTTSAGRVLPSLRINPVILLVPCVCGVFSEHEETSMSSTAHPNRNSMPAKRRKRRKRRRKRGFNLLVIKR